MKGVELGHLETMGVCVAAASWWMEQSHADQERGVRTRHCARDCVVEFIEWPRDYEGEPDVTVVARERWDFFTPAFCNAVAKLPGIDGCPLRVEFRP